MNLRRAFVLAVWWAIPVLAWSQQPSEMKPVTDQLAASIYNGPSMTTLGELADGIGGRLTGSPRLRSLDGMGGGEVSQLRNRERAPGAIHHCSGLAARNGERSDAGAAAASAEPGIARLGARPRLREECKAQS